MKNININHQPMGFDGWGRNIHTDPTSLSVKKMLSAVCHHFNEASHLFQLSCHTMNCFIITFIANIYQVLTTCPAEKTDIRSGGNGRVQQPVCLLTSGDAGTGINTVSRGYTAMKERACLPFRSPNSHRNEPLVTHTL